MNDEGAARPTDNTDRPRESSKSETDPGWLRDHWSQILILFVSLLASTCYLIGRARLLGWYNAAGVPPLLFNWSTQDLVIKGLADTRSWLLMLTIGVSGATGFAAIEGTSAWLIRRVQKCSHLRGRGESLDRLNLRKRWAKKARALRLTKHEDARLATEHWRMLGWRGSKRFAKNAKSIRKFRLPHGVEFNLLLIALLIFGFCIYSLIHLFYADSHTRGYRDYCLEHLAATQQWPNSGTPKGWQHKPNWPAVTPELIADGRTRLKGYAFVRVSELGKEKERTVLCGWLIQGAASQLVLLGQEGLQVVTFADVPFQWQHTTPEECNASERQ